MNEIDDWSRDGSTRKYQYSLKKYISLKYHYLKSSRDVTCTLLSLVYHPCLYTFCTAIPTSIINFIQLFMLVISYIVLHGHCIQYGNYSITEKDYDVYYCCCSFIFKEIVKYANWAQIDITRVMECNGEVPFLVKGMSGTFKLSWWCHHYIIILCYIIYII